MESLLWAPKFRGKWGTLDYHSPCPLARQEQKLQRGPPWHRREWGEALDMAEVISLYLEIETGSVTAAGAGGGVDWGEESRLLALLTLKEERGPPRQEKHRPGTSSTIP